jgi:hypothetical protein
VLIDIDSEVDVAEALQRIIMEDNIASEGIPTKDKPRGGVFDRRRQPEYQSVVAFCLGQAESTRVIF